MRKFGASDILPAPALGRRLRLAGCAWAALSASAMAGVAAPPLTLEQGNTYDLYAGFVEQYDSNLYRLSSNLGSATTLVAPDASKADRISIVSAGVDAQWILGRQVVTADLHADQNWFAHNTTLNNTSGYARALWDWQLGRYFSGTAGANYSRALVSFGETLYLGRDLVDATDYFGTARYQMGPHWALYGGVNDSTISHSSVLAETSDFETKAGNVGLEYAVNATDALSVEYRYDDGRFRAGQVFTLNDVSFSPDFHDGTALVTLKHSFSDKTQLVADAGYLKRYYPDTSIGTFSGDVWRVTVNWLATEKTQLAATAYRELHAYLVSESDYFVSTGVSLAPTWYATEKVSLALLFSYEHQNYIEESLAVTALGPVKVNIAAEQAVVNYAPRDPWMISLTLIRTNRTSNSLQFQYDDNRAGLSVLYKTR